MGTKISTHGIRLDVLSDRMLAVVRQELAATAFEIESKAKQNLMDNGTTNTGALAKSIGVDFSDEGLTAEVVARTDYAFGIEFGRPPGTIVDPQDLVPWARKKLGLSEKEAIRASWAIAQSIERKGSPAQPYLYPAFTEGRQKLQSNLKELIRKAT